MFLRDNILALQLQLMLLDQLWHLVRHGRTILDVPSVSSWLLLLMEAPHMARSCLETPPVHQRSRRTRPHGGRGREIRRHESRAKDIHQGGGKETLHQFKPGGEDVIGEAIDQDDRCRRSQSAYRHRDRGRDHGHGPPDGLGVRRRPKQR